MMKSQKVFLVVTPANAGVQNRLKRLDSGFRQKRGQISINDFNSLTRF
jgi:hypothetical protein